LSRRASLGVVVEGVEVVRKLETQPPDLSLVREREAVEGDREE
jgi:hypothetical protein